MTDFSGVAPQFKRFALMERGIRPRTHRQIESTVRRLCEVSQSENIADLDQPTVREFLCRGREEQGWSPKTFHIYWQYLKTFFDWACRQDYVSQNPLVGIEKPKVPKSLPRCLTREQALRFVTQARWTEWSTKLEAPRNEAMVAFFLFTGARLSEVVALRECDVNLSAGEARILHGKGQKERVVTLHPRLSAVLRGYVRAKGEYGYPSEWFFNSVRSPSSLTSKNVQEVFRRISKDAKLKVTPHMLRHTFGRMCVEGNVNLRIVQAMMGHSDVRTTQIYTFVSTEGMRKTISKVAFL